MNNAQQQQDLKEILEAQIREKNLSMEKSYKVRDVGFRDLKLHRSKM